MVEELIKMMERNGANFTDREESLNMLKYSVVKGWFKFLNDKEGNRIGFVTYIYDENDHRLTVTNLCIMKGNERKFRLFSLRRMFKEEFGKIDACDWHNDRRQKFNKFIPIE